MITGQQIQCACGCGTVTTNRDKNGRERKFAVGHFSKTAAFKQLPRYRPEFRKQNVTRSMLWFRARKIVGESGRKTCTWAHIGGCSKRIEVAHIDQNPNNNTPSNLIPLCSVHHKLMDIGLIDPKHPVMPIYRHGKGINRKRNAIRIPALRDAIAEAAWSVLNHDNDPHDGQAHNKSNWKTLTQRVESVLMKHLFNA